MSSADIRKFLQKLTVPFIFRINNENCVLIHNLWFFPIYWIYKSFFDQPDCNLMMLAKLPTPVFLKIEGFLNKGCYYVKMFVCDITSKMAQIIL